jgi:hypothetical protein
VLATMGTSIDSLTPAQLATWSPGASAPEAR